MAGLKQIMEIFKAINQPLSSEQRVRWYKQRKGHGRILLSECFLIQLRPGEIVVDERRRAAQGVQVR